MKVVETREYYNSDHSDASRITVELITKEHKTSVSFGEGEPEDMYLFRDLSDAYDIAELLYMAYKAGKKGEDFQHEVIIEE